MRLVASMIVHNELDRYLLESIECLRFCDAIAVYSDGSTDGTVDRMFELVDEGWSEVCPRVGDRAFYQHEGQARQRALDFAMELEPTHILVVDGDEIVEGGDRIRAAIEREPGRPAWSLCMEEVWGCDAGGLSIRQDGGWAAHPVPILYRVASFPNARLADRALASGRVPMEVGRGSKFVGASIFHFGWARVAERQARHSRYVEHDGGKFHRSQHLESIMWDDTRVKIDRCPWPPVTDQVREELIRKVARP